MQNYNNPPQPPAPPQQGGYGMPPQPPQKKGMSTGVKVLIGVVGVAILGAVLVVVAGIGGVYWLSRKAQEATSTSSVARTGLAGRGSTKSSGAAEAEAPKPSAEQAAAIAGGQSAGWEQQEISWTVPQKWKKYSAESTSFLWRSPGSWDAASLIVNISPMASDFPAEISLEATYNDAQQRKSRGEVNEVRWLALDGVKGVMFRESAPESPDNPQRLQWIGYRTYKGQTQYVNIMLASRGKDFARHEDALYGILYSTKLSQ